MEHDFCPVAEAIQLLQEKWVLHIVRALLPGPLGLGGSGPRLVGERIPYLETSR